jgi:signal transduction histidine kinase
LIEQVGEAGREVFMPDLQKVRAAGQQLLSFIDDRFCPIGTSEPVAWKSPTDGRAEVAAEFQVAPGVTPGSLLVVDDNEGNRDVLLRRLESQGYAVSTAENGRQALAMLGPGAFDLVLLDIMMPEMDGYEVLQTLKADEKLKHIPVIMISALSEMESVARCIEMGAEDYLPKPFNATLLKARISASLERKRGHDRETQMFAQLTQNFARLKELETLRDDLTHMIIHDLRTPLTSVISGMQTLELIGELNSGQQQVKNIAVGGGETLLALINDLLDVEKLDSGTMRLDIVLLSIGELIASACRQIASLAESKQLTFVVEIPDDLPAVEGDEIILGRILVNLLGNAIKFSPPGGPVTIEAHCGKGDNFVEIAIHDSGEGIPPEAFERIFEKFGQVESGDGASKAGTGLGLTFCRLAVESHGGQIWVEAVPSQGTTFRFTLPLRTQSGLPVEQQDAVLLI